MKNKVIIVCGPTASGKTSLSIELAKRLNAEIVSCDSMQIYKEMNIGTAKPDLKERDGVIHHMMDIVSVCDEYNVSKFVTDAQNYIDQIINKGKSVIIVGGTGLYVDSLINNVNFFEFDNDEQYREQLMQIAQKDGGQALLEMLNKIDPESAERLHSNDFKRIIRALEVYKVTGKTQTQLHIESVRNRKYDPVYIALNYNDRQLLYDRINLRVDLMLKNGLVDEAKSLEKLKLSKTARAAIGYADIFEYLDGNITLDEAADNIKQKSRNYAKRQITWFKRNPDTKWFYADEYDYTNDLFDDAYNYLLSKLR